MAYLGTHLAAVDPPPTSGRHVVPAIILLGVLPAVAWIVSRHPVAAVYLWVAWLYLWPRCWRFDADPEPGPPSPEPPLQATTPDTAELDAGDTLVLAGCLLLPMQVGRAIPCALLLLVAGTRTWVALSLVLTIAALECLGALRDTKPAGAADALGQRLWTDRIASVGRDGERVLAFAEVGWIEWVHGTLLLRSVTGARLAVEDELTRPALGRLLGPMTDRAQALAAASDLVLLDRAPDDARTTAHFLAYGTALLVSGLAAAGVLYASNVASGLALVALGLALLSFGGLVLPRLLPAELHLGPGAILRRRIRTIHLPLADLVEVRRDRERRRIELVGPAARIELSSEAPNALVLLELLRRRLEPLGVPVPPVRT